MNQEQFDASNIFDTVTLQQIYSDSGDVTKRYNIPSIYRICARVKPLLIDLVLAKKLPATKTNFLQNGITEEDLTELRKCHVIGADDNNIFINWKSNRYHPGCSLAEFAIPVDASKFPVQYMSEAYQKELDKLNSLFNEIASKFHTSWYWVRDVLKNSYNQPSFELIYSDLVQSTFTCLYKHMVIIAADYGEPSLPVLLEEFERYVNYRER